jgi:SAM-dependent methyltransferase
MPLQTWNPAEYEKNARFVSSLGRGVLEFLSPKGGERILDIGCGDGALTAEITAVGAEVVGIDSSEPMVDAARNRGLDARIGDAQALAFESEFDAVFSNAALHWMPNLDAVLAGVYRALKAGGRFVAEFGGQGNIAAIRVAQLAVCQKYGGDPQTIAGRYYRRLRSETSCPRIHSRLSSVDPSANATSHWYGWVVGHVWQSVPRIHSRRLPRPS